MAMQLCPETWEPLPQALPWAQVRHHCGFLTLPVGTNGGSWRGGGGLGRPGHSWAMRQGAFNSMITLWHPEASGNGLLMQHNGISHLNMLSHDSWGPSHWAEEPRGREREEGPGQCGPPRAWRPLPEARAALQVSGGKADCTEHSHHSKRFYWTAPGGRVSPKEHQDKER